MTLQLIDPVVSTPSTSRRKLGRSHAAHRITDDQGRLVTATIDVSMAVALLFASRKSVSVLGSRAGPDFVSGVASDQRPDLSHA
jgi:hypothetical protein